jgi:streptomycin 6-kinase
VTTGPPFRGGSCAWTAPAERADGTPAVLKVTWPHREAREEGTGLAVWDGHGAVRLLEEDHDRFALLVERCLPSEPMTASPMGTEAEVAALLDAGAEVLAELWSVAPPVRGDFERVGDVTAEWAGLVRDRMERFRPPFDAGLVAHGAELLESLPRSAAGDVLVHGDFNPGNLLRATRRPWLAIDAKPMVGDPAYDPMPLLLQVDHPLERDGSAVLLRRRTERFCSLVGEDPDRVLGWAVARGVESALWDVSRGRADDGARDLAVAGAIARTLS